MLASGIIVVAVYVFALAYAVAIELATTWLNERSRKHESPIMSEVKPPTVGRISDNGIPRRNRVDLYTPAELAIREAMLAVEAAGFSPILTEAIILLGQAKDRVADFVELPSAD
jgi:hypothetical protein